MTRRGKTSKEPIPVVDLFAGPGGLGEGFASLEVDGKHPYRLVLSVECDPVAHQTLELRAFYREFVSAGKRIPSKYFKHVRDPLGYSREALFADFPKEADAAKQEACLARLGEPEGDAEVARRLDRLREQGVDLKRCVMVGGPPCQAYSLVGRSRMSREKASGAYQETEDGRHVLYKQYLKLIKELSPTAFVVENVRGILSAKYEAKPIFPQILKDLESAGYDLHPLGSNVDGAEPVNSLFKDDLRRSRDPKDFLLYAHHYGVPQKRARVFVVGTRGDLGPTTIRPPARVAIPMTVKDAISDLPSLRSGLSKGDSPEAWGTLVRDAAGRLAEEIRVGPNPEDDAAHPNASTRQTTRKTLEKIARPSSRIAKKHSRGGSFVEANGQSSTPIGGYLNHETRGHIPTDIERYLFYSAWSTAGDGSPRLTDLPTALLPAHANIQTASKNKTLGTVAFADRFRVQVADQPATTVTSHISKDGHYYIHYDPRQCRSLTVREAARLQTFPDDYFFCGPRTEQYKQVGNAVPPMLATKIAEVIADAGENEK